MLRPTPGDPWGVEQHHSHKAHWQDHLLHLRGYLLHLGYLCWADHNVYTTSPCHIGEVWVHTNPCSAVSQGDAESQKCMFFPHNTPVSHQKFLVSHTDTPVHSFWLKPAFH